MLTQFFVQNQRNLEKVKKKTGNVLRFSKELANFSNFKTKSFSIFQMSNPVDLEKRWNRLRWSVPLKKKEEYLVAKIGADKAENGPRKEWCVLAVEPAEVGSNPGRRGAEDPGSPRKRWVSGRSGQRRCRRCPHLRFPIIIIIWLRHSTLPESICSTCLNGGTRRHFGGGSVLLRTLSGAGSRGPLRRRCADLVGKAVRNRRMSTPLRWVVSKWTMHASLSCQISTTFSQIAANL